ncbi:activated RNA polymerase II transcriptional coactivator p15-like [Anneissia japonica]|uniref:activated RNA polymerase II transcriptional coactivator p15-like n=1 Tax=Anneissia japonica TaxID=1529436 RepID=UPI0014259BD3|nr:activated RNA polymerase II transcriptional coactivator p15-like [Anneissia japonica]
MPKSKEFLESSDDSDTEKPVAKKSKKEGKKKSKESSSKDEDPNRFELSRTRFVNVREFKGKVLIDIREYYEAGGEMKPGKKGISLSVDQWKKLKEVVDDVDDSIKELQ